MQLSPKAGYAVALAAVGLALVLDLLVPPLLQRASLLPFLGAIVVAGFFGGRGPGIAALAISAVAGPFVLQQPVAPAAPSVLDDAVRDAVLVVTGAIALGLTAALRTTRDRAAGEAELVRQSQGQLLTVLDSVADPIAAVDMDGKMLFANSAAASFFGEADPGTARRELQGVLRGDALLEPDGARVPPEARPVGRALAGERSVLACRVCPEDGPERWLELKATPISDDGHVVGAVVAWRDATADHEAAEAREAFMGVLAHELRTPITTVYGGAQLLMSRAERLSESAKREIAADVFHEATRLYRTAENLLVLSRFERGQLEVVCEPVILEPLVRSVVESEAARWPATGFEVIVPPSTRRPVLAAPGYVEQVLRNFLSNAAKYSGAGGSVEVLVGEDAEGIVVSVSDDGPGFPMENAERLFELYYRCPRTALQAPGSGIGLYVCRRLLEAMGGRIWAESREAGGATFAFRLPTVADELVGGAEAAART